MALPKGYKVPDKKKSSSYMKFEDGANKFRIVSPITTGSEWWEDSDGTRKPYRVETYDDVPTERWTGGDDRPKHFWAMVVWNYNTKSLQVLELTQKSLQKALEALEMNPDWGDLVKYDITITKSGKGRETSYSPPTPSPSKPLPAEVKKAVDSAKIDLTALFRNENPFNQPTDAVDDVENLTLDDLVSEIA